MKTSVSYREKTPKKIIMQKVKLFNPNGSPTPSPLKKVPKLCSDLYHVSEQEESTLPRSDIPVFSIGKSAGLSDDERQADLPTYGFYLNTETTDYQTPTVTFVPRRPKRFAR